MRAMASAGLIALFLAGCCTGNRVHPSSSASASPRAEVEEAIFITLMQPEVNGLNVTVNGVTIHNPDGPFHWDWGDGTTDISYFPNMHRYAQPGAYQIKVQVTRKGTTATKDMLLNLAS